MSWIRKFLFGGYASGGYTGTGDPSMALRYEPIRRGELMVCGQCGRVLSR